MEFEIVLESKKAIKTENQVPSILGSSDQPQEKHQQTRRILEISRAILATTELHKAETLENVIGAIIMID